MTVLGTLEVATSGDREIVMTRLFNAPRKLVWDAMTRPELLARWLSGPPGWSMTACQNELREGAAFRWAWHCPEGLHGPEGRDLLMCGVHREIVPPERIVRTESFAGDSDAKQGEQLATLVLAERDGPGPRGRQTTLSLTLRYASRQARDASLASGVARNMNAAYDALDKLLAGLWAGANVDHAA